MNQHSHDIETVPHDLGAYPTRPRASTSGGTLASSLANFLRGTDRASPPSSPAVEVLFPTSEGEARQAALQATLFRHWNAAKAEGITASQFIAFLQPLADLDGITVSYICNDEDGDECVCKAVSPHPRSQAIRDEKRSSERALSFALNEEGRVWIESNFVEPEDLVRGQ